MSNRVTTPILVVDDDLDAGQNLSDILVDLGYEVSVASDGARALQIARDNRFEIALLDLKMPGMDGLTLASKLKELSPSMVVILTTARWMLDLGPIRSVQTVTQGHPDQWRIFPAGDKATVC